MLIALYGVLAVSLLAHSSVTRGELNAAVDAIARGDSNEAQVARLVSAGRPGLWLAYDAAKKAAGPARARLFEALGAFATEEATWALKVELDDGEPHGKAGALRGLSRAGSRAAIAGAVEHSGTSDETLRNAVVDVLAANGGASEEALRAMIESGDPNKLEVALRYFIQVGSATEALAAAVIGAAMDSQSPALHRLVVALIERLDDRSHLHTLAVVARSSDEELSVRAVKLLGEFGGWLAAGELRVIVEEAEMESVRSAAVHAIRAVEGTGFASLILGISRTRDAGTRAALCDLASENMSSDELDAAVEALADSRTAAAARVILDRAGDRAKQAAAARLDRALPELADAIHSYLGAVANRSRSTRGALSVPLSPRTRRLARDSSKDRAEML